MRPGFWMRWTAQSRLGLRALRHEDLRRWLLAQCVSQAGFYAQSLALGVVVLDATDSGIAVAAITTAQYAPTVIVGPLAGVVGDRFDRRRILVATQACTSASAGVLVLASAIDAAAFPLLVAVSLVIGVTLAFDQPMRRSLVADLVPRDDVVSAVSLGGAIGAVAKVAGPAVGGVLASTVGVEWCFASNAASSVAVIVALVRMSPQHLGAPSGEPAPAIGMLRETLRYVRGTQHARVSFGLLAAVSTAAYNWDIALLLLSTRSFGAGAGTFAALTSSFGIGALIGTFAMAARPAPGHRQIARSAIAYGAAYVLVGLAPVPSVAYAACAVAGYLLIPVFIGITALLQTATDVAMRARIMAFFSMTFIGGQAVGAVATGWVSDHLGVRVAIAGGGASVIAVGLVTLASSAHLSRIDTGFVRRRPHPTTNEETS